MGASAPSAEPVEAAGTFLLLSFHGTLLGYQRSRKALCQRDFSLADPDRLPLRLGPAPAGGLTALLPLSEEADRAGPVAALAGFSLGPGLYSGSLHLRRGGLYLSAERNGGITIAAPQCLGWESFLPLPEEQAAHLKRIMSSAWLLPDGATVAPEDIGLQSGFALRFGGLVHDLRQGLPGVEAGGRIVLTIAGGASVVARPCRRPGAVAPTVWILPLGNTANRALQYLTAAAFREELPETEIVNLDLPEWGMVAPAPPPAARIARTGEWRYRIDVTGLADCLRRGVVDTVVLESYTFHLEQYPPRAKAKLLLGKTLDGSAARGFGPGELACSVRGGEVLTGIHPDYLPLPPGYYRLLAERTGLEPVFFGQLGDDPYTASLREAFPNSRFISGTSPGYDFDTLRRSVHIAASISSFAWLAAWLSEAETVILPVGGMFSPVQHPDQLYLPHDDPAYQFVLLPYAKGIDLTRHPKRFFRQQALLAKAARFADAAEIRDLCLRGGFYGRGRVLTGGFDPDFYAARNADVAHPDGALDHYLQHGAAEGREPLAFDPDFYVSRYPDAAMEIAVGLHPTPLRHFMAVGWRKGYAPIPSAM